MNDQPWIPTVIKTVASDEIPMTVRHDLLRHSTSAGALRMPAFSQKASHSTGSLSFRPKPSIALSNTAIKGLRDAEIPRERRVVPRAKPPPYSQQRWKVVAKEASSDREWSHARLDASQKRLTSGSTAKLHATSEYLPPATAQPLAELPYWQPEFNGKHRYSQYHWVRDTSPLLLADLALTRGLPSARQWLEPLPMASNKHICDSTLASQFALHTTTSLSTKTGIRDELHAHIPLQPVRRLGCHAAFRSSF